MKKSFVIFMVSFFLLGNLKIQGNDRPDIRSEKSIYFVLLKTNYKEDNNIYLPLIQICKFDLASMNNRKYLVVQEFEGSYKNRINMYDRTDLFTIENESDSTGIIRTNIISVKNPWKRTVYQKKALEDLFPIVHKGTNTFLSIDYDQTQKTHTYILDLKTLRKIVADKQLVQQADLSGIWLTFDKGVFFNSNLIGKIPLPYNPVVSGKPKEIYLISSSKDYALFANPIQFNKTTEVLFFNKKNNKWSSFIIEGEESEIELLAPFIVCREGYQKGKYAPTEFTGNWELINYETGKIQKLKLSTDSKILFSTNNYLLVATEGSFCYAPITNGLVNIKNTTILINGLDGSIESVFFGPRQISKK